MNAVIERLPTGPLLPRPEPGRMRPLRAGIRNVWEYDDQELWFEGGRLILRGQNTAGKSKALEVLLPFVLDGDTRPERLDPFGGRIKTMYWNLVEFDDERSTATGYVWVEFGRVDDEGVERFVTCLVGMRGQRSTRKVETWFAVTPGRIGLHLELAPGGIPLTAERLREAMPDGSVFSRTVRDHRAAVDHALFDLGPDRYESLLHLLLQLRRPKLSEKLDLARLREYLSEALPPLERSRMESLAQAFARLDEDTAEIERLEAASGELHRFLDHYRAHARLQTRRRCDAVRSANTQFDKVTETERRQREARDVALVTLERIDARRAELADAAHRLEGQLRGLDLSKVHALHAVEEMARAAADEASRQSARAAADRERADAATRESTSASAAAAAATRQYEEAAGAILPLASGAGLATEHQLHGEQLAAEPRRARTALSDATGRRLELLAALRRAGAAADVALARIRGAEAERTAADAGLDAASEKHQTATGALEAAGADLLQAVLDWAGTWHILLPGGTEPEVVDAVLAGRRPGAGPFLAPGREHLHAERRRLAAAITGASERRAAAEDERTRVAAEADDAPPARPGRPATRPDGHAPLWACVDFAPDLDAAGRAGLEAALEASGLLDALVAPDGDLLDATTLDTWIRGAADAPGADARVGTGTGTGTGTDGHVGTDSAVGTGRDGPGVDGLVSAAGGPAGEDAVARALAGIAAAAVVRADGRWRVGPLQGRWSKDAAEYIGAAARAEARRRRIETLTAEIDALTATLATLAGEDDALAAELGRLDEAERAWPSTDPLRDASAEAARALTAVGAARESLAAAEARLAQARGEGQAAVDGLRRAEDTARCRAADVEAAVDAVRDYREALAALVADAERVVERRATAGAAASRAGSAVTEAGSSEAEATRARAVAATARGEADELRATVGADAETVLARQAALTAELEQAQAEDQRLTEERDAASRQESAAAALLAQTEAERIQREAERAEALSHLAELAATELARLALGPVPDDRDLTQVTAGLAFARTAHDKLRDVEVDQRVQDDVNNRLHHSYSVLRSQLGADFDPYLDTSDGLEVCYATLNGAVVGVTDLSAALDDQIRRRRETLSAEERQLIERHLLTEIGSHLGDRVHAAWDLTRRMNQQLAERPTRGGITLRLSWETAPQAGPGAEEAMKLLRHNVGLLDQAERAALAAFLHERVRAARDAGEGSDVVERLATALDYRTWHHFTVHLRTPDGREQRMTAHTHGAGSGGEQAKLAHLPLFAATAAYYSSARPDAPRLLMLDEAFAGIDDSQRGDCMGMLVGLDLDMVLTNYAEWGCYPEVPAVAVYHLERTPGQPGVVALRFVWNGADRREDDPWLDSREPPERGLFA